mmetsp:Transcript_12381/g.12469  ORF Transcript_12381/g.12469 Transcript_12381/m.12469 type:complete len:205 (+) Transcript_12381:56-670(+)|eukprot:CAMPEP_0182441864 /NCGR_PEP_ID=MMETSP1172-20130603/866_1 /TAXON_ID=708627 /ORGANISM="Timspurckia oligopyrenoides, Strain CCMP3278" /LENGTH=204 /DNA_ID=CAMNT_0024636449 /DNA_START=178 /DNA_END=792 /DNA_ORIENTATION=+
MAFVSSGLTVLRGVQSKRTCATKVTMAAEMSKSVPFLLKPKNLEGYAGNAEFDPLGISDYVDMRFLREAELKHGRICMLAAVGILVQEFFTFGGKYFPKMLPVDAHDYYLKTGGMSQLLLFIAGFESMSYFAIKQTLEGKREPGDFAFDPLSLGKDPAVFARFRENELKNGRLAMIAVGGFIHQMWVSKMGVIEQLTNFKMLSQ